MFFLHPLIDPHFDIVFQPMAWASAASTIFWVRPRKKSTYNDCTIFIHNIIWESEFWIREGENIQVYDTKCDKWSYISMTYIKKEIYDDIGSVPFYCVVISA